MAAPLVVGIGELLWDLLPSGKEMGGAPANFAYHAHALGARGIAVSRVGNDDPGREILERMRAAGLDVSAVGVDPGRPTGTVSVRLDAAGKPHFTIHEDVAWDCIALDPADLETAGRAECVCFGTLAQRSSVSREAIGNFLDHTGEDCLRVFDVNLRQRYYDAGVIRAGLKRASVLKLNDEELPVLSRLLALSGTPYAILDRLVSDYSLRAVALTRGEKGCLLSGPGGTADHRGFPPDKLVSTVGAGDAFTAALVLGLLKGKGLDEIAERANRLASYVCTQPGAMPKLPESFKRDW